MLSCGPRQKEYSAVAVQLVWGQPPFSVETSLAVDCAVGGVVVILSLGSCQQGRDSTLEPAQSANTQTAVLHLHLEGPAHSAPGKKKKLNLGESAFILVWIRKEVTDLRLENESNLTEGDSSQQGSRAKPK